MADPDRPPSAWPAASSAAPGLRHPGADGVEPGSPDRGRRSFWLGAGLIVLAQLFLAWVALRALSFQAREEEEQRRREAHARVRQTALAFVREGTNRWISQPGLTFPPPAAELPRFRFPETRDDQETFLRLSMASGPARTEVLLEALLNATPDRKPLWNLLLGRESLAMGDEVAALRALERVVESDDDARLASGWTLRGESARLLALEHTRRGRPGEAGRWLRRLSGLPGPEPVPERADLWWPATGPAEVAVWAALLPRVWTASGPLPLEPRWGSVDGRMTLSLTQAGKGLLIPGDQEWRRLEGELTEAAGPGFPLKVLPQPVGDPLPGMAGIWVQWLEDASAAPQPGNARVWTGLLIALGLLGIALLMQTFWRREAEGRYWSEQERFYRQAAHDLKTPLATMRALAETLSLGRVSEAGQAERYFQAMIREADQAAGVVDVMLLAARLRGGLVAPACETVYPQAVLAGLLDRLGPRLGGWQRNGGIPETLTLRADPGMFARALLNLLENVLRHAGPGRELLVTGFRHPDGFIEIAVGDRGPGRVAGDTIESAPGTRGSGLGLELTRAILARHEGELILENREGGGILARTRWPEEGNDGHHPDH